MAYAIHSAFLKARKFHRCYFCLGEINKGDMYMREAIKDGGDLYTWKTCEHCIDVINKYNIYERNDELTQGDFEEIIEELCQDNGIAWQDMDCSEMVKALLEVE